jgi:hypothetical protein
LVVPIRTLRGLRCRLLTRAALSGISGTRANYGSAPVGSCSDHNDAEARTVAVRAKYTLGMTFRVILEHDPETGDYSAVARNCLAAPLQARLRQKLVQISERR